MKRFTIKHIFCTVLLGIFLMQTQFAQVGIGTVTPRGALDIGSNSYGIVYPRVALTANNVQTPVVNPNGGNIVEGTMVYNTTQTMNATNNVYPGIYAWNGTKWAPQFIMEENEYMIKLQKAISNLTEAQRVAFLMNRIEGKKHKEIAALLSISTKAVEKRIYGALKQLRQEIEGI